ncbi:hypothetical protein GCM10023259_053080 [Thermocatellispora tengchongensis]
MGFARVEQVADLVQHGVQAAGPVRVVLPQPPSSGLARSISSMAGAAMFRHGMAVGTDLGLAEGDHREVRRDAAGLPHAVPRPRPMDGGVAIGAGVPLTAAARRHEDNHSFRYEGEGPAGAPTARLRVRYHSRGQAPTDTYKQGTRCDISPASPPGEALPAGNFRF